MPRKRFSAEQLAQHAAEAIAKDRISPPTREVSLSDVVRALSPNIQARRDAGHPFPQIAGWLRTLGYEVSAATLCVYWHRLSREGQRLTAPAAEHTHPPPAPAVTGAGQHTNNEPASPAAAPAARPVPVEAAPTITTPTRSKRPRNIA